MTQGYDGLPPYYVQSSNPTTPNLGLVLIGVDPIVAENFVLIDAFAAGGGGTSVLINGITVTNPNFNGIIPAAPALNTNITFQVSGSSVSAYIPTITQGPTGSGTANTFPLWTAATVLGNNTVIATQAAAAIDNATALVLTPASPTTTNAIFETHNQFSSGVDLFTQAAVGNLGRAATIHFYKSHGANLAASPLGVAAGDALGIIQFKGYDTTTYGTGVQFEADATETWSASAHGSRFLLATNVNGSTNLSGCFFALAGTTSAFPAFKRSSANVNFRLADDSADTGIIASIVNATTGFQVAGAATTGNALRGNGTNFVSAQLAFSDLSGNISVNQMNSGTGASNSTFWRGDGTWSSAGTGTVTSVTFTGDGVVLSNTPSGAVTTSGTVTATLASAAGGTVLGRAAGTTGAPAYTSVPVLGINASTAGTLGLANGGGSGQTITLQNLGATSAYNFNLPTTVGAAGTVLTSQGGGSTSMTWATGVPGTSCPWDGLTSAVTSNLTLANAGFTTTFNQTSAVAWTWGNTTPTIAPALTLTQVTVVGAATTYTGTITGGGSNAYVGASVTFAGFVTGGNNVAAQTITASTATTLVVTTTTQANETHAGTAVSSAVVNSPTHVFSTTYEGASNAPGTDTWTVQNVIGSLVANPTSALTFTHAGSTGNAAVLFPAGTATAPSVTVRQITQGLGSSSTSTINLICGIQGGNIAFGDTTSSKLQIVSAASPTIQVINAGNTLTIQSAVGAQTACGLTFNTSAASFTATGAVNQGIAQVISSFAPTSGTANFWGLAVSPTINQTGGASGTIRCLAVYPQNTAVVGTEYLLALGTTTAAGIAGTNTDLFLINSSGVVTNYAGTATIGQGVPSEIGTIVDSTAQSAAITATNIIASAPRTGMYRISMSATITTAASTSSVLGGTNGFQVGFTSPTDSVAKTTVAGNSITTAANTTGTAIADTITVYAKTGTAITYAFDYSSVGVTAMVFEIHARLEAL